METQISTSTQFEVGAYLFLIGPQVSPERNGKVKYLAYVNMKGGIPDIADSKVFLYVPADFREVKENMVIFTRNATIYMKGDKGALLVNTLHVVGEREVEPDPKVGDIAITDFIPEDLANPDVPAYKVPPSRE